MNSSRSAEESITSTPRPPLAVQAFQYHLRRRRHPRTAKNPLRFIARDDHGVVEARGEMRTKAGVPYNNEYCLIYRLKDGKIVEFREYCDSALTEAVLGKYPAARAQA